MLVLAGVGLATAKWRAPAQLSADVALQHEASATAKSAAKVDLARVDQGYRAGSAGALEKLPETASPTAFGAVSDAAVKAQARQSTSYRISQGALSRSQQSRPSNGGGSGGSAAGGGGAGGWGGVSGSASRPRAAKTTTTKVKAAPTPRASRSNGGGGSSSSNGNASDVVPGAGLATAASAGGKGPGGAPAATPEPLSILLVGAGLAGLYGARKHLQ